MCNECSEISFPQVFSNVPYLEVSNSTLPFVFICMETASLWHMYGMICKLCHLHRTKLKIVLTKLIQNVAPFLGWAKTYQKAVTPFWGLSKIGFKKTISWSECSKLWHNKGNFFAWAYGTFFGLEIFCMLEKRCQELSRATQKSKGFDQGKGDLDSAVELTEIINYNPLWSAAEEKGSD